MVPVLYCTCILCIIGATFGVFVLLRLWQYRVAKRPFRAQGREPHDEEEVCLYCPTVGDRWRFGFGGWSFGSAEGGARGLLYAIHDLLREYTVQGWAGACALLQLGGSDSAGLCVASLGGCHVTCRLSILLRNLRKRAGNLGGKL